MFKCLKESGVTAFFTRSSAANIPVNMSLCESLGLDKEFYSVSIPLGATLGAVSWFYIMKKDDLLAAVNTGSRHQRGALWYGVGRYVYVPLAVILCCVALFMNVAF